MLTWEPLAPSCRWISCFHLYFMITPQRQDCRLCFLPLGRSTLAWTIWWPLLLRPRGTRPAGVPADILLPVSPGMQAAVMLTDRIPRHGDSIGSVVFMQAMAASVLLRGLLYASVHQAPRRWLPLRKSAWGIAQQGMTANLAQLRHLIWARTGSSYAPETSFRESITYLSDAHTGGGYCFILRYAVHYLTAYVCLVLSSMRCR